MVMPLIGKDNLELAKELTAHVSSSKYEYKSLVYHGLELNKTSMQVEDLSKYQTVIKELNAVNATLYKT